MKILIIDDEERLAQLLKKGLERDGFAADYLTDGESGLKRIEFYHKDYDLVILDLMMPKKTGYEVCHEAREKGISIPIIVLTAKDGVEDKTALLNMGADDYLVKPFSFQELSSRIRAILRRPKKVLPVKLTAGGLTLDQNTKQAFYEGREIKLTLKEFSLLEYLMRYPNTVIDRERIITNVWDFDVDLFNNIVDVYINRLRNKLDKKRKTEIIETVRGVGYKLKI